MAEHSPMQRLTDALDALHATGPVVNAVTTDAAEAHYGRADSERGNSDNETLSDWSTDKDGGAW